MVRQELVCLSSSLFQLFLLECLNRVWSSQSAPVVGLHVDEQVMLVAELS